MLTAGGKAALKLSPDAERLGSHPEAGGTPPKKPPSLAKAEAVTDPRVASAAVAAEIAALGQQLAAAGVSSVLQVCLHNNAS